MCESWNIGQILHLYKNILKLFTKKTWGCYDEQYKDSDYALSKFGKNCKFFIVVI